jgi:hypothetical protein
MGDHNTHLKNELLYVNFHAWLDVFRNVIGSGHSGLTRASTILLRVNCSTWGDTLHTYTIMGRRIL